MNTHRFPLLHFATFFVGTIGLHAEGRDEDAVHELQTYTVTGSHLITDPTLTPQPLTTVSEAELALWSDLSPNSVLRDLPFSFGFSNSDNESNGGTGSAGANLRGLGNLSTLTLINGRRAGGNSAFGFQHGGFADLNLIPSAAIREIQVATDGTSVTYGSDAVAGTVNLLLHDDYIGNRVDASYSDTTDGDASEKSFSFLTGQEIGEKTHLVLLGSWYQRNAIFARDREISEDADFTSQGGQNQGSLTFPGRISVDGTRYLLTDPTSTPSTLGDYQVLDPISDRFNFNENAPSIPEFERRSAMAHLTHELNDNIETWVELLYTETRFENGLAPGPWTLSPSVGASSPHAPDLGGGTLTGLSYRSFELGNLSNTNEKDALRTVFGLRGRLGEWDWETAAIYSETNSDIKWSGAANLDQINASILDGSFNPFAPAFASGDTGGVFYDNEAAIQAARTTAFERFEESLYGGDFKINGPIFELPAGEVEILFGLDYRDESVDVEIDEAILAGQVLGRPFQVSPFSAEREVIALYAESVIPIFEQPEKDASLDLQLGLRYEHYQDDSASLQNTYDSLVYKAGLVYQPTSALTIRGTIGTAFRAPTLFESFSAAGGSLVFNDPTNQTPPFARVPTIIFSNPDLEPEKSQTFNVGFTYEPDPESGWRASVDYYRIETKDAIISNGQSLVDSGSPSVIRSPAGEIQFVFANWINAANVRTDGIDYELSYRQPTSEGNWEASLGLNQVLNYEIQARSGDPYVNLLGRLVHPLVGGESIPGRGSIPRYKGYARLIWNHKNLTLGGTVNYIHSLDDNQAATSNNQAREIDPWTSLDLLASYAWPQDVNSWLGGTRLTLGIDNVTDEAPPFAAGAFADGYDSSLYTLEGRRFNISLSREF